MVEIRRILVATDFSDSADAAVRYANVLARALGVPFHVLHVIEDPLSAGWTSEIDPSRLPELQESMQLELRERLNASLPELDHPEFRGRLAIRVGQPAREIVTYARSEGVDLIVLGFRGHGGAREGLFVGHVAEEVVRDAPCSVLTVKRPS
jgi:nucleotide-binding universal stress UspA family protein